jgi:hypothetical protein
MRTEGSERTALRAEESARIDSFGENMELSSGGGDAEWDAGTITKTSALGQVGQFRHSVEHKSLCALSVRSISE